MKKFYKRRSFKVLIAVAIALLLLIVHTSFSGSIVLSNLFGAVTTPMQKVSAEIAESAGTAITQASTSYEELLAENEKLKAEINELNKQLSDYYQYKQENEQLKNFLDLKSANPDYKFAYGSVVARDSSDLFYSFRVDKGTMDGVSINDPVITAEGLVGWVTSVSAMHCNVTTILSPSASISAMDKVNRDTGVITSDVSLIDEGLVRLSYLENDHTVKKGDMIVTSGIGGIFPKNLLIGKAVDVKSSSTDVSLYATVEPYVDIKNVSDVLIITEFAGQGEVLPDSTDEAVKKDTVSGEDDKA